MTTRRNLLKTGTVGIAGLSGCLNAHQYLAADEAAVGFRQWLVDPRSLNSESYLSTVTKPSAVEEYSDSIHRDDWNAFRDNLIDLFQFARFYPEDLDRVIRYVPYATRIVVAEGDFEQERIGDNLRREDYLQDREYEGFELYVNEEEMRAVALDTDVIVVGSSSDLDAVRTVQLVIDARNGEERRYAEVDDDFEELVEASPGGHLTNVLTHHRIEETDIQAGQFRNQVGSARSTSLSDEESEVTQTLVFLDERDIVVRDIEDWTRSADTFRLWRSIEVSTNGRIATVEGTIPTRDILSHGPSIR